MFNWLFGKNTGSEVDPQIVAVFLNKFVSDLRSVVVRHFENEEVSSARPSESEKIHFWAGLASLAYMQDSLSTAKQMGRPVREPQDLVAAASVAYVVTQKLRRLTHDTWSEAQSNETYASLVEHMATVIFGDEFPSRLIADIHARGRNDGVAYLSKNELNGIGSTISSNFQDYVAINSPLHANFLGKFLKSLDQMPT